MYETGGPDLLAPGLREHVDDHTQTRAARTSPRAEAPEPVEAPVVSPARRLWPGLLAAALGLGGAMLVHQLLPAIGVLTAAVALGIAATNLRLLPAAAQAGLHRVTKRLLRIGVVLLGFTVSFQAIAALGVQTIALVAAALLGTLLVTTW